MKKNNYIFFLGVILFLLTGLLVTWLYKQSHVDYQAHRNRVELVRNIEKYIFKQTRQLLLVQDGQINHYDDVAKTQQEIESFIAKLPSNQTSSHLVEAWLGFKEIIEAVKSDYAVYKNSLAYFPKGVDDLFASNKKNNRVILSLADLERKVFQFDISGTHDKQVQLLNSLKHFNDLAKSLPAKDLFTANMLSKHVDIILNKYSHLEILRGQLLKTDIPRYSKVILHQYNQMFNAQVDRANNVIKAFYIVCIVLMLVGFVLLLKSRSFLFQLQNTQHMLRQVSDNAPVMLWMSDEKGDLVFTNDRCEKYAGIDCEKNIFTQQYLKPVHPEDRANLKQTYLEQINKAEETTFQYRFKEEGKDNYLIWSANIVARYSKLGQYQGLNCSTIDITQQKKLEEEIRLAAQVFEHSLEGILISNIDNQIVKVNRAFTELTGYKPEDVLGKTPSILNSGLQDESFYQLMWEKIEKDGLWRGEVFNRRKNGEIYPEWLTIIVLKDDEDKVSHHIAIFSDISEKKRAEQDIHFLAHFDALTRLPNRTLFYERAEHAMNQAIRNNCCVAILFLDLDRFKAVNDSLGHDAGDELLVQVAEDLNACVRDVDLVARIGGDEFTIILEGMDQQGAYKYCPIVAEKIIKSLSKEYKVKDSLVFIGVSIGVSLFPGDGESIETLMQHADMAMYHAKDNGRNNIQFYSAKLNEIVQNRLSLEADLRIAVEQQQLFLNYQPQYNLATQKIEGFEALIRWQHPQKGLIPPDEFISIAEECGLIIEIGQWVLEAASNQLMLWQQKFDDSLRMAINVSVKQLEREGLVESVISVLEQTKIPSNTLEIEVTESIFLEEGSITQQLLGQLDQQGVQLSMDDFGTGYSNMSYLKKLPIDRIKIDRCFVSDIPGDEDDAAIACAIIDIARHFGIKVIAEGIEHQEQADYLLSKGCDEGQGYLFSKPLSADDVEKMFLR